MYTFLTDTLYIYSNDSNEYKKAKESLFSHFGDPNKVLTSFHKPYLANEPRHGICFCGVKFRSS